MKKTMLVLIVAVLSTQMMMAQFDFGFRMGLSTQDVNTEEIQLLNGSSDLRLSLADASYGYHFGLYGQMKVAGITITPEVIFNSNTYEYKIQEFSEQGQLEKIIQDRYQYVDVPLLFGLKLGPLRAYAGPEVHYLVNSYGKLAQENGFSEQVDKINYGAIVGAGLNAGRLRFDIRYEMNFSDFEDHITFENATLDLNSDDSRILFSLGYKLN